MLQSVIGEVPLNIPRRTRHSILRTRRLVSPRAPPICTNI